MGELAVASLPEFKYFPQYLVLVVENWAPAQVDAESIEKIRNEQRGILEALTH